jgi:hypothetical protein
VLLFLGLWLTLRIYYVIILIWNILLVYASCTGGFIVTFPYLHMLYPGLVHPLH